MKKSSWNNHEWLLGTTLAGHLTHWSEKGFWTCPQEKFVVCVAFEIETSGKGNWNQICFFTMKVAQVPLKKGTVTREQNQHNLSDELQQEIDKKHKYVLASIGQSSLKFNGWCWTLLSALWFHAFEHHTSKCKTIRLIKFLDLTQINFMTFTFEWAQASLLWNFKTLGVTLWVWLFAYPLSQKMFVFFDKFVFLKTEATTSFFCGAVFKSCQSRSCWIHSILRVWRFWNVDMIS